MKVKVNDEEIFEISDNMKKVICNDIFVDEFEEDMKRRMKYIIEHKYERCFKRLVAEWCDNIDGTGCKLAKNGVKLIPTDPNELLNLIFSQPNYKCRKTREEEEKLALAALSPEKI